MRSLPHSEHRFSCCWLARIAVGAACLTGLLLVHPPGLKADGQEPEAATRTAIQVLDAAIQAARQHTSIQADLHESVVMGTHQFTATGQYVHGRNNQLRVTMTEEPVRELAVRTGGTNTRGSATPAQAEPSQDKSAAAAGNRVVQVCDGRVLWTELTTAEKRNVVRRDIDEILKAVSGTALPADKVLADIGLGGVPALLESLRSRMVFKGVREENVDGQVFVVVQGRWSDEQVSRFVPGNDEPDPVLPAHLPEYVRIYFDKDTLFPRRILYLKRHADPTQRIARPMLTLDFTNVVLNGEVDSNLFTFQPVSTKDQNDVTADVIRVLKANAEAAAKRESESGK